MPTALRVSGQAARYALFALLALLLSILLFAPRSSDAASAPAISWAGRQTYQGLLRTLALDRSKSGLSAVAPQG